MHGNQLIQNIIPNTYSMVAKLALEARMDAIRTQAKFEIFGLVNYPDSNALLDKI